MKILTITIKSTDDDDDFQNELEIISEQVAEGFHSGFDSNSTSSFKYDITFTYLNND